jgi:PH (Pleckstrin Homology) domain-containing protein
MPAADFPIFNNQLARSTTLDGIAIRTDVLFANEKGEEKPSTRKRAEKLLRKLSPALQRILRPDESVLHATQARSPLSILEQLTAAWWTAMLSACAIVVTNKRILFFPTKTNGTWRESVRAVHWGDLEEVKSKGVLVRQLVFKFKNGLKTTYTNVGGEDAKKFAVIAAALIPPASGEQTSAPGFSQLCPDCCSALTAGQYSCAHCGLLFKNEKTMITRSILIPAGGYFYTGHPLIAIIPALVEVFLILDILVLALARNASPNATADLLGTLLILVIFWGLETGVTILHCRRYVRDFIPEKRDPARSPQPVAPRIG